MKWITATLFVFLLLASAHAAADPTFSAKYENMFTNQLGNWPQLAMAAILIGVFFNALIYMVGKMLDSESIKKYAKVELLQVTASALMIFFAVELLFTLSTGSGVSFITDNVIGANSYVSCGAEANGKFFIWHPGSRFGIGPIGAFKCKLQEKITALDNVYTTVVDGNRKWERYTSMCFSLFSVPVYCGDWDIAVHKKVEEAHLLAAKIVGLLIPLHAEYALASYIENNMLSVFLPLGLILRILPVTRGIGALFISIAVGFFFIWPTFFILTDPSFVHVGEAESPGQERQEGACFTGFKGTSMIISSTIGTDGSGGGSESFAGVEDPEQFVFQMGVTAQFYPFVSLVITLVFIRMLAPLLGGEMGDLTKMITRLG